ncbi:type II toxin-antitoxin system HicA family toxin [bacterium]|nr:type II toxin-antitoxin system HicA family toxin [bacterium]MCI0566155.1 type II toxin-antitoxin system HicA family toxin [bacterium]MCI0679831.1 type II toxin-antitoxin system HicA family toxin [bacterium]
MSKLPQVRPRRVIKALLKAGYSVHHVTGSHYILYKDDHTPPISVAYHNKPLKKGTLAGILKQAGLSLKDFLKLL